MKIREKWIPLAQAKIGMVLSEAVHDHQGHTLLMPDTTLNEASISGLRRRNINSIAIQEQDNRSEEELSSAREETTQRISALFASQIPSNTLSTLQQLVLEYRLRELA